MQTFAHKEEFTLQFQRGTRKRKPLPRPQTKEEREGIKPHPQPLSKERGVICSPIIFYLLSISKAFYSPPSSGRGRGRGFVPFLFSFVWTGGEASLPLLYTYCLIAFPYSLTFTKRRKQVQDKFFRSSISQEKYVNLQQ